MKCNKCGSDLSEEANFCNKCGAKVGNNTAETVHTLKTKIVSGLRITVGIIVGLFVFGTLATAFKPIIYIGSTFLFGIESAAAEDIGTIFGFIGAAYLANLVYIAIMGKDSSGEKKKWYQFGGFMSTGRKTKARPILAVVIVIISSLALILSTILSTSLKMAQDKAGESGQYVTTDNWISYNNAPNFSIDFPSHPVHDTKTQDTPNGKIQIDSYRSANKTADVAYVVNVSSFSSDDIDVSDPSAFLENTVRLSANNGTIIRSNPTTKNGYPAVDYLIEIEYPDTTGIFRGLNILADHKLYQLLTAYDKSQEYLLQYDKFVNSFQIK